MSAPLNLVNLERVHKAHGTTVLLDDVSLGVAAGERIGVVGRNGGGKTTLLSVLTGREEPDSGRVTRRGDIALQVWVYADKPVSKKRIMDLAQRQVERL